MAALTAPFQAPQAAVQWTATGDGAWEDAANWTPAGVPTAADFVEILFPTGTVTVSAGVANELETDTTLAVDGGSLAVTGSILNSGSLSGTAGATLSAGLVRNGWNGSNAVLELDGSGTSLTVTQGLVNDFITQLTDEASLTAASLDNTHSFEVWSGAGAAAVSMVNWDSGALYISGAGSSLQLDGDPAIQGDGALTNRGGAQATDGGLLKTLSIDNLASLSATAGGDIETLSMVNTGLPGQAAGILVSGSGSSLTITTSLVSAGLVELESGATGTFGSITNQGEAALASAAQATSGSFTNEAGAGLQLRDTGTTLQITGALGNSGTLDLGPGTALTAGSLAQDGGETVVDGATLTAGSLDIAGGRLRADTSVQGSLIGDVFLGPGGTLEVGIDTVADPDAVGRLDVDGGLDLDGLVLFDIAGTTPVSGYDVIDATGGVSLAGTFEVDLVGGFTPDPADVFDIIFAATVVDAGAAFVFPELAALGFSPYIVDLGPGSQVLRLATANPIPLPPAIYLLLGALVPLVLMGRPARRRRST